MYRCPANGKLCVLTCDSHELIPVESYVSGDKYGDVNDELPKSPEMSYRPVNARHEKAVLQRERAYLRANIAQTAVVMKPCL
jgi:hypothetical protein